MLKNYIGQTNYILLFILPVSIYSGVMSGADKFVCDRPVAGHACTYPNRQLQKALDEAKPGDTLYLQAGFTYNGGFLFRTHASAAAPILVTSSKADWLPGPKTRVSPSDLPNMPVLMSTQQNQPALSGVLDAAKQPPAFWHFVGIAFAVKTPQQFDNSIIHTAGMGVNGWKISGPGELPQGLVFDRIFVSAPYDDSLVVQNAIRLNGAGLVLKNSFVWPLFCAGIECHAVSTTTNPGPLEVTNSFLSAASIPMFTGGTDPDYPEGGVPTNVSMRYNYLFRPLKWWPNPGNPERAYFLKNGSKGTCTKNLLEFKAADKATIEYNVHENIWSENACQGQWFGFAITPRETLWESPGMGGSWGPSTTMGTLTTNGTSFSWTGAVPLKPGQNVCVTEHSDSWLYDCRKIAAADPAAHSGTVKSPFSIAAHATKSWGWVSDPTPLLRDVTMQNEVFRNVAGGFNIMARDRGPAEGDEGLIVRLTIRNTLLVNTLDALHTNPALRFFTQEVNELANANVSGRDITFEHNTYLWKTPSYNVIYFAADGIKTVSKIQNLSIRSNIFPDSTQDRYALGGSGAAMNRWDIVDRFASGTVNLTNNQLWGVVEGDCRNAVCRKNFGDAYAKTVQFIPGTYKIKPGSPLYKAGHDGADVGVNADLLPLISNLSITPAAKSAVLAFDLSAPIADAAHTQPCVLEVSPDENLKSYLGSYSVTNDLNPAYFRQANASSRTNASLPKVDIQNGHVSWPIGSEQAVKGDDGQSHDLNLRPASQYWGRLMCYGDTREVTFTTKAAQP